MKYSLSLKAKLVYIFRINDTAHKGCLKIGEATLDECTSLDLKPNCHELNQAAKARISQYTKTASIQYDLLHTEITFYITGGTIKSFNDKEVHDVLLRSGVKKHDFSHDNQGSEWFETDLATALEAIKAVKAGKSAIDGAKVTKGKNPIAFRPEQKEAIAKTVKKFKNGKAMLWNAKMRFGKTLSALQVVKECKFHRTLILTHRPVVDEGWFEDFGKIFTEANSNYRYGSRNKGFMFEELERDAKRFDDRNYVYFASMQDLRGSKEAGGKFDKNNAIFSANWDLLIVDEAHEGTQTKLGQNVLELLTKEETRVLNLSGTPFNLLDDYKDDEIYTWDYVMEQRAKQEWDLNHFGDPNPYAGLPRLNMFTFDLGKIVGGYADIEDKAFNFKEFFRTWTGDETKDQKKMPACAEIGSFIHEKDVRQFLDLIVKYDKESNYPFSTVEYRQNFRHSLWMVPGVKEAKALSQMLQQHPVFGAFEIVNVAGEGDDDEESAEALKLLEKKMGKDPSQTYTITLSCGRLTTGVTVKPWTAVFMLAGSSSTDAKAYMQTIFRVQSPYEINGRRKEECFVFDFAPDRTLKVIAEVAKVSARAGKVQSDDDKVQMGQFLNFCPIIGYNGTKMERLNTEKMLEQLKKVYVDKVVRHGFEDSHLYNDNLLKLTDVDLEMFNTLKSKIGSTKANTSGTEVDVNKQGFTDEQFEKLDKAKKKKKKELTEEEKALLEEAKKKKENANKAASILRGISIRMPLLIYGARLTDEEQELSIDKFADLVDDASWLEFMPNGVDKEMFAKFTKYYDEDIFRAAGRQIREMARATDELAPLERVKRIARIFSYFRNPDKETVLTPWRVVNMHISDCIGGYDFFDEKHETELEEPRYVEHNDVTANVFDDADTRILEINSKTGLYPLFMAYSVFARKCKAYRDANMLATEIPVAKQIEIWDSVLRDNIFVICKTEMAKSITRRTLAGFRDVKVRTRYFEDLINQIKNKPDQFVTRVRNGKSYWKANEDTNMKFNAIVGNPPYQVMDGGGNGAAATPIYNTFVGIAKRISPFSISMIMPARWYAGGRGLDEFRKDMLNDNRIMNIVDFPNPKDCFPNTNISGGVCYFLWKETYKGKCLFTNIVDGKAISRMRVLNENTELIRYNNALEIIHLIKEHNEESLSTIVSDYMPFGLRSYERGSAESQVRNIKLYSSEGIGYLADSEIPTGKQLIDKYKVIIGKAISGHLGETDDKGAVKILARVETIGKRSVCTESYLCCGCFTSKEEAYNLELYLKTKFCRFLLLQALSSMNITNDKFKFVPLQDFSQPWTDEKLYAKYNLTPDEINYIESLIKPME